MKSWGKSWGLGLTAGIVICFAVRAQLESFTQTLPPPPDSIVSAVADEKGLPLVPPGQVPRFGTFWTFFPHASSGVTAPSPCLGDTNLPVYEIAQGQFLVDGSSRVQEGLNSARVSRSALRGSAADTVMAQAGALINLVDRIQGIEAERELSLLARAAGLDVPMPGEEGSGEGTNAYGASLSAQVFTTNDLWLEITGTTNGTGTSLTAFLTLHPPWNETNGVYDLFATTNLAPSAWRGLTRCSPGQTNLVVTNLSHAMDFFILGLTNDTDGGGLTDAYELLVTHTATNNPDDDLLVPVVGIQASDSVAVEQQSTNTATFTLTRLGGYMGQPLTLALGISGTATAGTDYTLSTASVAGTNLSVTIPAGQTSVTVTLAAVNDSLTEGTETTTLTLLASSNWTNNAAHSGATAWILEVYTVTYTLNADFNLGVLSGLEPVNDQLQFKTNLPAQFPFINVACSDRGTVARINTTNGVVIGEYRTTPEGQIYTGDSGSGPQPSRTTVDLFGNVWLANRADDYVMDGTTKGSITRIGLIIGGTRYDKNGTNYSTNPNGQYVSLADAAFNTCVDRDGDGYIRTSSGLADILPWTNQRDGLSDADSRGGVSTAEDEAITEYTRVSSTGTRTIAVDKFNDLWVGGLKGSQTHLKVNGLLGRPVAGSVFQAGTGGYGGIIDRLGHLWSTTPNSPGLVLWLAPSTNAPPQPDSDWKTLPENAPAGFSGYGIAVDPLHPYIWQTVGGAVFRWHTNGTPVTNNLDGGVVYHPSGSGFGQGLAVDARGQVWVAHGASVNTVGHLDTNGAWLGNVTLRLERLRAEFYANTNLAGLPALVRADAPVDFDWGAGAPDSIVPTNYFSVRWSGVVTGGVDDYAVFFVSADAEAGFRLAVNGSTVIDNWDNPNPSSVEISGTNWLFSGENTMVLEYKEFTGDARVKLSWLNPSTAVKDVIPGGNLKGPNRSTAGPTGVSVDSLGNIWSANKANNTAMRINPNAGEMVVTNGVTNHVGEVDMVVDLGDGSGHPAPYNVAAAPYNYSDMTGFNNRIVNPALQPLKGYWTVVDDCGLGNQIWQSVTWSNNLLMAGCGMEVYVRASDNRQTLANESFVAVSNNVPLVNVMGRYIEVRVGMIREDASQQTVLYDLTLHGASSGFDGDLFLEPASVYETDDAWFWVGLTGAEPVTYQWQVLYPWADEWMPLTGATNWDFTLPAVDLWDDWTQVKVTVSNNAGQVLQMGPAELAVYPLSMRLPGGSTNSSGPAERYPATIHVRGEPANGLERVELTLHNLRHAYPSDLDILLVSPSGAKIMLMSDAGSSFGVTNATLVFHPNWQSYQYPPETSAILSDQTSHYSGYNWGEQETQLTGAPAGPYTENLDNLPSTDPNPNGIWKLYIYDDKAGQTGVLQDSWSLEFFYQ